MDQTNMHINQATSGNDIGVCTASNITGLSTYFTYFQQRTYSTPTTECLFYSGLSRNFHILIPEDHSSTNLAHYMIISNESSDHNGNLLMAATTNVGTTNPERELLEDLRNKITKTSSVQYVVLAISLLVVTILVIVIAMKFKAVCVKKKARDTERYDLDKRNTSNEFNDHNESTEIYEEPVWRDDRPDAIKVKPNAGYAKHLF
jgi:cell division protein FtsL